METELMRHLKSLAFIYERKEFIDGDPSWFMHQIEGETNKELLAFIASALSYGSRKQFMKKINLLFCDIKSVCDNNVKQWLVERRFCKLVPNEGVEADEAFYRLYSNRTFNSFLEALALLVESYGSLKAFLMKSMTTKDCMEALTLITDWFANHNSKGVIPQNTSSSCKRLCMFMRWMVRDNSTVDIGIWSDIIDKRTLIMPMDTHVVQEAMRLGIIKSGSTSMTNARRLTSIMANVFPDDPLLADFALFGYGVSEKTHE